jgi:hypothetical protein
VAVNKFKLYDLLLRAELGDYHFSSLENGLAYSIVKKTRHLLAA